jgi:hypothetical protein
MPFYGQSPPSFSKSSRFSSDLQKITANPGPGQYEAKQTIGITPAMGGSTKRGWTMRARTNMQNNPKKVNPGPGEYDLGTTIGSKNIVYGTAHAKTFSAVLNNAQTRTSKTPGPGQYEQEQRGIRTRVPAFTMRPKTNGGGGGRDIFIINAFANTDGSNSIKEAVQAMVDTQARKGAQVRLPAMGKSLDSLDSSGPVDRIYLTYRQGWKTQSVIVEKKKVFYFSGESPGAGTYEPKMNNSVNSRKPRAAAYTMRKKTLDLSNGRTVTPGPVYNQTPTAIKPRAASYSMRKKLEQKDSSLRTPGPGAHNPNLTYVTTRSPLASRTRR